MDTVLWDQTAGVYPIQSYRQRFSGYSETRSVFQDIRSDRSDVKELF